MSDSDSEEKLFTRVHHGLMVACALPCLVTACAYILGGDWKYGYTVHKVYLERMVWRRLEPQSRNDGPMHE